MNLNQKIAEYGAEAVSYYVKMAKLKNDNEVREEFFSAQIAMKLFERGGLSTHVERDYLTIVRELGGENNLTRHFIYGRPACRCCYLRSG